MAWRKLWLDALLDNSNDAAAGITPGLTTDTFTCRGKHKDRDTQIQREADN